jgi:hypothetical protein
MQALAFLAFVVVAAYVAVKLFQRVGEKRVSVTFVDTNGQPLGRSEMPASQLPDSFQIATTLEMQGNNWSVVRAEPATKSEFATSGQLRVVLAPVQQLDPKQLLFSLPTISDELPAMIDGAASTNMLQIHEDDWRQREFVSAARRAQLVEELQDVNEIHREHKIGLGFDAVHIRKRIPRPLEAKLRLDELMKVLTPDHVFEGVALDASGSRLKNGYAFRAGSLTLWGTTDDN